MTEGEHISLMVIWRLESVAHVTCHHTKCDHRASVLQLLRLDASEWNATSRGLQLSRYINQSDREEQVDARR
jgi:hypothetical protein